MHFFIRETSTKHYYAGHGTWTSDSQSAIPFPSPADALEALAGPSPLLEIVLHSEVTHSSIAIPSLTLQTASSARAA